MYETGFSYTFKSMKKQETLFYLLINRQVHKIKVKTVSSVTAIYSNNAFK